MCWFFFFIVKFQTYDKFNELASMNTMTDHKLKDKLPIFDLSGIVHVFEFIR